MNKLSILYSTLNSMGLKKEAQETAELNDTKEWLSEWRDCMRHYGFQNFGRDDKWWKEKSFLHEPKDAGSAAQDIILVTEVHSPSEEGRRVSNTALDNFIKEFYGDGITVAPREGWRKNMTSEEEE
jgi:hypothetical protein